MADSEDMDNRRIGKLSPVLDIKDQYDGFDIMDFERPSLSISKGRHNPHFDVSDSELEEQLLSTWEKNRKQKKTKKQEREELRAMGLLGKKNKFKPDLNIKYKDGMSFDEIKNEMRQFLLSDNES
jgi:hypothetical protein